jgi:hypothetical protein
MSRPNSDTDGRINAASALILYIRDERAGDAVPPCKALRNPSALPARRRPTRQVTRLCSQSRMRPCPSRPCPVIASLALRYGADDLDTILAPTAYPSIV